MAGMHPPPADPPLVHRPAFWLSAGALLAVVAAAGAALHRLRPGMTADARLLALAAVGIAATTILTPP